MANPSPASSSYIDANQRLRLVQILISPGIVYSIPTNSKIPRWKNLNTVHYNFIDIAVYVDSKPCIISRVIISIIKIQFVEASIYTFLEFYRTSYHIPKFQMHRTILSDPLFFSAITTQYKYSIRNHYNTFHLQKEFYVSYSFTYLHHSNCITDH